MFLRFFEGTSTITCYLFYTELLKLKKDTSDISCLLMYMYSFSLLKDYTLYNKFVTMHGMKFVNLPSQQPFLVLLGDVL